METTTPTDLKPRCIYCGEAPRTEGSNFCSQICFELWYSLTQAKLLNDVLERILNESFEVVDANTRPS